MPCRSCAAAEAARPLPSGVEHRYHHLRPGTLAYPIICQPSGRRPRPGRTCARRLFVARRCLAAQPHRCRRRGLCDWPLSGRRFDALAWRTACQLHELAPAISRCRPVWHRHSVHRATLARIATPKEYIDARSSSCAALGSDIGVFSKPCGHNCGNRWGLAVRGHGRACRTGLGRDMADALTRSFVGGSYACAGRGSACRRRSGNNRRRNGRRPAGQVRQRAWPSLPARRCDAGCRANGLGRFHVRGINGRSWTTDTVNYPSRHCSGHRPGSASGYYTSVDARYPARLGSVSGQYVRPGTWPAFGRYGKRDLR
jgi:hypothetical protein